LKADPALLEAIDRGYAAWNERDLEAFLATVHPEIVWETSGRFPGLGDRYVGHDGVRQVWGEIMGPWESFEIGHEEVIGLDHDSVLVHVRFRGRGREGIEVEQDFGQRYEIRDGLLTRMKAYPTWDAALAAARDD
jgi:ketosteroid isomerase-like protein